jgi:hypothetical protein
MPSPGRSPDDAIPGAGSSSDLRRALGAATESIHGIIDAAERVAGEIRADAEARAAEYLAERRREAERIAEERIRQAAATTAERARALDALVRTVAESAQRFRVLAEEVLADLDRTVAAARAGIDEASASPSVRAEPSIAPLRRVGPEEMPAPREPEGGIQRAADAGDQDSEALLRATQMAVVGRGRTEISEALKADFPGVDVDSILDEIFG